MSWKGCDFLTKIKHFRTFVEQNTFIKGTKMIKCVHLAQEKVDHSLAVNFLTSDSFASCTEMNIFGNSILCLIILSSKTVKQLKQDCSHSCFHCLQLP